MKLRRSAHAVYETLYHIVWIPKYRKAILVNEVGSRVEEMLREIAVSYDVDIVELHVAEDHVPLFCSFAPRESIAQVVGRFKSLTAKAVYKEFPAVRRKLWGGGRVLGTGLLRAHCRGRDYRSNCTTLYPASCRSSGKRWTTRLLARLVHRRPHPSGVG